MNSENFKAGPKRNDFHVVNGVCPECGLMHPPTPGGCPIAAEKNLKNDGDRDIIVEITKRLVEDKGGELNSMLKKTLIAHRIMRSKKIRGEIR